MMGEMAGERKDGTPAGRAQLGLQRLIAVGLIALVAAALFYVPVAGPVLGVLFILYAALLLRFPHMWLLALPVALPLLDFRLWSGWFMLDSFDLAVWVTLAAGLWHARLRAADFRLGWLSGPVFLLFVIVQLIGIANGLGAPPPLDLNGWYSFHTPYNALRLGKGFLWALLLLPLIVRAAREGARPAEKLAYGIWIGAVGVGLVALWERATFSGLFNFATEYRISANFADMHIGGGAIDAYLVLCLPFFAAPFLLRAHWGVRLIALCGAALALHTILVTFSRAAYAGTAIAIAVLALLAAGTAVRRFGRLAGAGAVAGPLICLGLVGYVASDAPYVQSRIDSVSRDYRDRLDHWGETLRLRAPGMAGWLLGNGVGSFPRAYLAGQTGNAPPGSFTFMRAGDGNVVLRLRGGTPLYFRQVVSITPQTSYNLSLDLRPAVGGPIQAGKTRLRVYLCEQALNYSFRCHTHDVEPAGAGWRTHGRVIETGDIGADFGRAGRLTRRPVHFALYAAMGTVEIDNVRLTDAAGKDLIANGGFEQGGAHWYFDVDDKRPWHIDSDYVHVLFEAGLVGFVAFTLLLLTVFLRLGIGVARGQNLAGLYLAALAGYAVVALAASPLDGPRVAAFIFLILYSALAVPWTDSAKSG